MMSTTVLTVIVTCIFGLAPSPVIGWSYGSSNVPDHFSQYRKEDGGWDVAALTRECKRMHYIDEACLDDNRILTCNRKEKIVGRRCRHGKVCGNCEVDSFDKGTCSCIHDVPRPSFPRTGRISWQEKYDDVCKDKRYGDTHRTYEGEMRVTDAGHYLYQTTSGWVTMIIPNGDGTFIEYKRKGSSSCSKRIVSKDGRKNLTWLWVYFSKNYEPHKYELWSGHRASVQTWGDYYNPIDTEMGHTEYSKKWWMRVKKLKGKQVAIPLQFYMLEKLDDEWWGRITTTKDVKFQYSANANFTVEDYCDNITKE